MRFEGRRNIENRSLEEIPKPGTILIPLIPLSHLESEIVTKGFSYLAGKKIARNLPNFQMNEGLLVVESNVENDRTVVNVLHNGSVHPIQWHGKLRVLMSHGFIRVLDGVHGE